ncbi:Mitochondrial peculiar membrane protein 1 [Wickerhamomyces ciferrii]|uniref:Mitochondrial peculiar membrane protein 1 n=1 Tax=Wickerhamomyces ciferrii (strain ATCC 14091 / BCRC 22168 / CBS 111 / JCM 3599 / NBRC 0793 / NRRL Y-1031 F-60-10) TaxID=1206466 RepID=K0KQG7_WICCF|nr:Mitochondrial peculiar membrane protein 1 [Wickerhamomyces ciferrii]CCH45271.1 Mitochondrial peculiar membrane protein 1 [Wickerhamomyces ciferrii]
MGIFSNSQEDKDYTTTQVEQTINNRFASNDDIAIVNDFLNNQIISPLGNVLDLGGLKEVFGSGDFPFNQNVNELLGGITKGFGEERFATGLKAYPTPSAQLYQKCLDKDGLSVWDDKGWWRCLFPKGTLNGDRVLSKEDVLEDKSNKYGLFFNDYTGFLGWKSQMKQLIRQKDEEQKISRQRENIQDIYNGYAKDISFENGEHDIISSSKSVSFRTLPNGDGEEITEISNYFKDGKSENKKFKRLIPKDGQAGTIETISDNNDSKLSNWIWGK